MLMVGHLFTAPCSTDQPPPPWLGAFFREPLGYSRKLGERLLDLASAASWAICFTPSPTARRRARPVSMIVGKAVYGQSLPQAPLWRAKAKEWPINTNARRALLAKWQPPS